MRLRLTLKPGRPDTVIPVNYNQYLNTALTNLLSPVIPPPDTMPKDIDPQKETELKRWQNFCFSQLRIPLFNIDKRYNTIAILSQALTWYLSFPVDESQAETVKGLLDKKSFSIGQAQNEFRIEQVDGIAVPEFSDLMDFSMLSPVTISQADSQHRSRYPYYFRANDDRLSESLRLNVLQRYKLMYGSIPKDTNFEVTVDMYYVANRGGVAKITKLIFLNENQPDELRVYGFLCPVTIEGNPELIKFAYETGLGEKGQLGFGMMEVRREQGGTDNLV